MPWVIMKQFYNCGLVTCRCIMESQWCRLKTCSSYLLTHDVRLIYQFYDIEKTGVWIDQKGKTTITWIFRHALYSLSLFNFASLHNVNTQIHMHKCSHFVEILRWTLHVTLRSDSFANALIFSHIWIFIPVTLLLIMSINCGVWRNWTSGLIKSLTINTHTYAHTLEAQLGYAVFYWMWASFQKVTYLRHL
jgi:hypothetical protein